MGMFHVASCRDQSQATSYGEQLLNRPVTLEFGPVPIGEFRKAINLVTVPLPKLSGGSHFGSP